jgi:hypothetical protein
MRQFLLLPESTFLNIILCSLHLVSSGEVVGVDGLRPAVKTRSTTIAPGLCAAVLTSREAPELFLLA